jgi:hypothetical protein
MKRTLAALLSVGLLSGAVAVPAIARPVVCDQEALGTILTLGYGVFKTPYVRCQFRLFISQPQLWNDADYFHGGTFTGIDPGTIEERGWNQADIDRYYRQVEQHLYWGTASTPDAQLTELSLMRGPIFRLDERSGTFPGGTMLQETYFDFAPQEPGLYKWRYTYDDAILFGSFLTTGEVRIRPA